ncbi:MAG: hypothetical protein WBW14_04550 [Candidatus Acidiferrum sp.]
MSFQGQSSSHALPIHRASDALREYHTQFRLDPSGRASPRHASSDYEEWRRRRCCKLAEAYSARGDKSSALRVLRRSVEDGFFCYPYFTRDPLLDPLRCELEFSELLHNARHRHEEFQHKIA